MAARTETHGLALDTGDHRAAVNRVFSSARADGLATRRTLAQALYGLAHIDACVVRATREQIAQRMTLMTGRAYSPRTVEGLMREYRAKGLAVTLEGGLSAEAHAKLGGQGPRVPLYALTIPADLFGALPARSPKGKFRTAAEMRTAGAVDELADLPRPAVFPSQSTPEALATHTPEGGRTSCPVDELADPNPTSLVTTYSPRPTRRRNLTGPGRKAPRARRGDTSNLKPTSKAAQLAAELAAYPVLSQISDERRTRLLRPFARTGWGPADIRRALDITPHDVRHINTSGVRYPLSWTQHRLSFWLDTDGSPLPSVTQRDCPGWQWPGPGIAPRMGRPDVREHPAAPPVANQHQDHEPEPVMASADARAAIRQAARTAASRLPRRRRDERPLTEYMRARGITPADPFGERRRREDAAQVARHTELHGLNAPRQYARRDIEHQDHGTPYQVAPLFLGRAEQTDTERLVGDLRQ